jgi:hypothetical protein
LLYDAVQYIKCAEIISIWEMTSDKNMRRTYMKNISRILVLSSFGAISLGLIVACGSGNSSSNPVAVAPAVAANGCQAGYVMTQDGCLPQGSCPAGEGQVTQGAGGYNGGYGGYNGSYGGYNGSGCLPQVSIGTNGNCSGGAYYSNNYGCLAQGGCPYGELMYNGTCMMMNNLSLSGIGGGGNFGYSPYYAGGGGNFGGYSGMGSNFFYYYP